jgi:hypothetical protein
MLTLAMDGFDSVTFFIQTDAKDRCIIAITTLATSEKTQDIVENVLMDLHIAIGKAKLDDTEDILRDSDVRDTFSSLHGDAARDSYQFSFMCVVLDVIATGRRLGYTGVGLRFRSADNELNVSVTFPISQKTMTKTM